MNKDQVVLFEKLQPQIQSFHKEVGELSKKKPHDGINKFKLNLINQALEQANALLGDEHAPFNDFTVFDTEELPTNSDVVMILSQYLASLEVLRAENIQMAYGRWYWTVNKTVSEIQTMPPAKLED